jgi:hypothetical protein
VTREDVKRCALVALDAIEGDPGLLRDLDISAKLRQACRASEAARAAVAVVGISGAERWQRDRKRRQAKETQG